MQETTPEERRELRYRAVRALVEHPSLEVDTVRTLRASNIRMEGDGRLRLELHLDRCTRFVRLSWWESECLFEWMEEGCRWGSNDPIFAGRDPEQPLTRDGMKSLLRRLREGR